jgi:hypothetical protein
MRGRDHGITSAEKYNISVLCPVKKFIRVRLHILTEEHAHGLFIIPFKLFMGGAHEAGGITLEIDMICMLYAQEPLFRDISFIVQPKAYKCQHRYSTDSEQCRVSISGLWPMLIRKLRDEVHQ